MSKNRFYKIEIINFDKHQRNLKKGHKSILLATNFLSDPKIRMLTPATKLLFLCCLLVAGESTSSHIEVSHDSLCFQSGVKSGSLQCQLDRLQSLQLLRYNKIDFPYNIIEKNRIEDNRKEKNRKVRNENLPTQASKAALRGCIPELSFDAVVQECLKNIKQETQYVWLNTYKNEKWIAYEINKAKGWILENANRAPKSNFGRFYSNWLSRGFESYRKTLQGKNEQKSFKQAAVDRTVEMIRQFEEEPRDANKINHSE